MSTPARWFVRPGDPGREGRLARELGVSPLVARFLVQRGLREPEAAASFLESSLSHNLRSPMQFAEMPRAAGRLLDAVRRQERIAVYGDYDVDGITGATQLLLFLRDLGATPELFIPHRMKDGYGLRAPGIQALAARGASLIVTADCGAAAHEEIALAASLGVDVIVCDHHQNPAVRPPAHAVLNPVVSGAGFPFQGLSAAGVVFYLLLGTRMLLRETGAAVPDLRRYLDLVALGTVADLVPLVEENRVLVKYGLREIATTDRPGIRALCQVAGVDTVDVDAVGFRLAPRLNASGRLADATRAVEMLATGDPAEARRLAASLNDHNLERRGIEEAIYAEAVQRIDSLADSATRRSFVLASEGWHAGVVGIVASRLVERYFRPVVLLAIEGDLARGSARGIPSVHLFEALGSCRELLERFGGHRMAAGLTIRTARIGELEVAFERAVEAVTSPADFVPETAADAELELDDVSFQVLDDLARLEPHGQGNPRPRFLVTGAEVVSSRVVGERHLKLGLRGRRGGKIVDAIAFRQADRRPQPGSLIDLVVTLELNRWEGREEIQLSVRDLRDSIVKTAV